MVAETLNLSRLAGYDTGGTIHIVINNQLGYTTDPRGRALAASTAPRVAQMLDIPIFHVNGDDPEACVHVMRLATEYRQRFQSDVVIDLVCFRRYGHNEGDEPALHPAADVRADPHAPARCAQLYARDARRSRAASAPRRPRRSARSAQATSTRRYTQAKRRRQRQGAQRARGPVEAATGRPREGRRSRVHRRGPGATLSAAAREARHGARRASRRTGNVERTVLERAPGDGATARARWTGRAGENAGLRDAAQPRATHVRLTGQDTERGTFGHRHAVLHDMKTGRDATCRSSESRPGRRRGFEVYNSPLSEMGCMGFEFGYSLDYPDALVALGGAVRRLRQRRAGHHRPVHRRGRGQVAAGCAG